MSENSGDGFSGEDLKKAFRGAGEKLKKDFGGIADGVDVDALKDGAEHLADEAASLVKKYPLQAALGVFAVGCLVGALFGRRRE